MPVINTNLSALIAQNAARASEMQSTQSMERLSTGLRINSAKDDAAGLAIATRMTSAIPVSYTHLTLPTKRIV